MIYIYPEEYKQEINWYLAENAQFLIVGPFHLLTGLFIKTEISLTI